MTHFSVLVRIPSRFDTASALSVELNSIMEPYQEHACTGECPVEFMEFDDAEDELRQNYENDAEEWVRVKVGERKDARLVRPWDEMFRVPGSFGVGTGTHHAPDNLRRIEIPFRTLYATLEDYAADYEGHKGRDPIKNRFGRWENPNKKWDYWRPLDKRIPARVGDTDCARIDELDGDRVAVLTKERLGKAWGQISRIRTGGSGDKADAFWEFDARNAANDFGVLQCVKADALTEEQRTRYRVEKQKRQDALEVLDLWDDRITEEDFHTRFASRCHPLRAWARVERGDGWGNTVWTEPAEMGWWAMHGASLDDRDRYDREFIEWLRSGDQRDHVVMLDCHI